MLAKTGKMGYVAAVVAVAMMAVPTLAHAKTEDSGVAAVVNGNKILKSQVVDFMKANNVKSEDEQKVYPAVVDQLIDEKLIQEAAAKSNIENTPEYKQQLAIIKENLAKQLYVQDYLKDKVNDNAIKAEYEKLKKDNKGKEEVHARHILVKTEDEAKDIIKKLNGGANFEELAKEKSIDPSAKNGGDIGYFAQGELVPAFSDAAFKLDKGTYTKEPVKTQFGWHVIMVEDKRTRTVPELKAIQDRIRSSLAQDAVKGLIQKLSAKADIKRYDMNGKPITGSVQ